MDQAVSALAAGPSVTMRRDVYKAIIPNNPRMWISGLIVALLALIAATRLLIVHFDIQAPYALELLSAPMVQVPALLVHAVSMGARMALLYVFFVVGFNALDVHRRWGIFKGSEPESHYWTSLKNWKVPFLWGMGATILYFVLLLDNGSVEVGGHPRLLVQLPDSMVFLHSPYWWTDVLYGIAGFYLIDLFDNSAHRLNHAFPTLYNRFPFAHFVHHNMVYLNPMALVTSPFVHLAAITGFCMYAVLLSQGLLIPVFIIHGVKMYSNIGSHMGCDPLPWLSRLNYRVGGWIPWIPLHHQYHHIPGVKGNYGNLTSLWDHVFGTLSPEYITHVTTGQPTERVRRVMENHNGAIDRLMAGKTRFNLR